MTLDASTLKKWRELCEAAQSGPWYPSNDGIYTDDLDYDHKIELSKENAAFIAEARSALPLLLDAYEKLQAENERLKRQLEKCKLQRSIAKTNMSHEESIAFFDAEIEEIK